MTEEVVAPALPKPVITVRNFLDEDQAKIDLSYSLNNLSDAYQRQPSFRLHYGTQAAKASRQVDDLKMVLEATESKVYREIRDEATKAGDKVTEAQLEKMVIGSPNVLAIKRAVNEAKQIEAITKAAVEGFKDRKDMLVQQGADSRAERSGEMRMSGGPVESDVDAAKARFLGRQPQ